jgi:hypothetical protein
MKKQIAFWVVAVAMIGIFSVLLSGAVQDAVVLPIIKFFWLLKGYYGSVHQMIIWGLIVAAIVVIAGLSLRGGTLDLSSRRERLEKMPGEVGQLSFWIRRSKHGPYPRWYVARTLADVALELLRGRGANTERGGQMKGPGWNPPGDIQDYLETAMRSTPATFARQLESAHVANDPEAESIVEYLETYAENSND